MIEDTYPLSPMQQGMLFNTLLNPGSGVDIEQLHCELHEALDVPAFQRAWRTVIARHPVLRTNLCWEHLEEPIQEVHATVELPWEEQNWLGIADSERNERIAEFLGVDRRRGFDLARAPLYRLTVLRCGEAEFHLVWTFHHTVLEGRSYVLVLREVFAFYEAFRQGQEISLPMPRPYRDYIEWLRQQAFDKDEAFWRETLKGFTTPTPLVVDHAPDIHGSGSAGHGTQEHLLSAYITSSLRSLAQDNQLTLNTLVQGAWALMLSRYSGEPDVVLGVVRANRNSTIEGAEAMVGLFLNTLPLRVRVDPEATLLPWLSEVRRQWMAMRGHEHAALANIQAWSDILAGSSLFQSTVMFENHDLDSLLRKQGGAWSNRRFRLFLQTNYPLDFAAFDGTELRLRIDFDRSRIDHAAAERMIGHLRTVLEAIATNPRQKVGALPLLSPDERNQLLVAWNQTTVAFPGNPCIHELFEYQVDRTPEAIAVAFEDDRLTYRELNRRANRLAHHLRGLGVGPDVRVAICAERSLEMVVGLLGILKAGGAYVPIDPTYPAERVAFLLNDAQAPVTLVQEKLIPTLPTLKATRVTGLGGSEWNASADTNLPRTATDENLAYVIYTSGSTGQPKGAMIPHRAIVNHLRWMQATFPMDERDCVFQKTEFSFDVSVWEFFAPLITGARLTVARPGGHQDSAYLVESINRYQVTMLQVVPSLLRMLLETSGFGTCRSLRHVFCGGEPMTEDIPRRFFSTIDADLHNMYGPTEVAIDATYYSVPRKYFGNTVPIGRPVANMRAYVLDRQGQPVPIGVRGELHLGGVQVGRGYHDRPGQTAERFVPDVFSNTPGAKMYKTGDEVRFLADGNIEFLGRIDHQVKVRGFRIELGEIEWTLQQHPSVRECAVVVREDAPDDRRLVAYVVSSAVLQDLAGELRRYLLQQLPAHMVPAAFVLLDSFPTTPNGKLDRKALLLRQDGTSLLFEETYVPPSTPTEKAVAASWRKVLQVQRVGIRDNFFELGGHSLMLVRLLNEINWMHGVSLGVPDLIRNSTVEQVAGLIDGLGANKTQQYTIVTLQEGQAALPVYFVQAGASEFRIARQMEDRHRVYGIDARWPMTWRDAATRQRIAAYPTMGQLVAPYVEALRAHARTSPCVLAGLSFAGLMAFETACQLQSQGGSVGLVILVDTPARRPLPYEVAMHVMQREWTRTRNDSASGRFHKAIGSRLRGAASASAWLFGKAVGRARAFLMNPALDQSNLSTLFDEQGDVLPWALLERVYNEIDKSYRPGRLDSRGILFRTDASDDVRAAGGLDDSLGWRDLFARGLEIKTIVGSHDSIFREHTPTIAREINAALVRR